MRMDLQLVRRHYNGVRQLELLVCMVRITSDVFLPGAFDFSLPDDGLNLGEIVTGGLAAAGFGLLRVMQHSTTIVATHMPPTIAPIRMPASSCSLRSSAPPSGASLALVPGGDGGRGHARSSGSQWVFGYVTEKEIYAAFMTAI